MLQHLMKWEKLLEYEPEQIQLQDVRWLIDFGPWKRGQYCTYIVIQFECCIIIELGYDRKPLNECMIKLSVETNHNDRAHPKIDMRLSYEVSQLSEKARNAVEAYRSFKGLPAAMEELEKALR